MYHLVGRFLHGWSIDREHHVPRQHVKSMWVEQAPDNDLSKLLAREFGFFKTRTVHEALIEGKRLGIAGVMIVAEHGHYPRNDYGQVLYPRFDILTQVVAAFHEVGAGVPVYVARQLSHDFAKAKQMVAWSRQMQFPLMGGAPTPWAQRSRELDARSETPIQEVLVAGSGPIEVGGFDAIEVLQSLAEQRNGGETGVAAVTCLTGKDVWRAGDADCWSWDLLDAALHHSTTANLGDVRVNTGSMTVAGMPAIPATAFLVEYIDGTRGTALLLNGHLQDLVAAVAANNEIRAGRLDVLPLPGVRHYDHLAAAIETFFTTQREPHPIERTLLTTGIIAAGMESHARRGARIETPHLQFGYCLQTG
jgi:hypothetical protein